MSAFKYKAFISYSHQDEAWANWLHKQLEGFQPPEDLPVPGHLSPIFQDREELAASRHLTDVIHEALAESEFLIVICSPAAASSAWVRAEIEKFIALGRDENILCLIVEGRPQSPAAECLPEPLRTGEPLAADVRGEGHARTDALLRLVAALLGVGFNDLRRREVSVAVLPFRDLSPDGDRDYLSEGFAEELLHELTQYRDLRVISRASSFQLKDSALGMAKIGEQLDATYVVAGSIRSHGNALRVVAQLVDTRTDTTRWSKTYDREFEGLFALQDEVAADVAGELHQTVKSYSRASQSVSVEAHQLTMRAKHLGRQFNREALQRASELLREALAIEPDYPAAWNALATCISTQVGEGFLELDKVAEARAALDKALEADPLDAEALAGHGWLALRFDSDLAGAAEYLQRAFQQGADNVDVLNSAGGLLLRLNRIEEAISVARRIVRLDPLNSHAHANLGVYSLFAGHYTDAIDAYKTALEVSPGFIGANFAIGFALLLDGDPEAAMDAVLKEPDDEFRTKGLAFIHWEQGERAEFDRELEKLIDNWGEAWASEVAEVFAYAGDVDAAFEWIAKDADDTEGAGWAESVLNPAYAKVKDDERWLAFLFRIGLAPQQLATVEFELPDRFKSD